jgi:predicted ester cyclase
VYQRSLSLVACNCKTAILQGQILATQSSVAVGLSGTHSGTWFGRSPTGRHFEIPACAVFIFDEDDKIAGERGYFDSALMLRQLGLLPQAG